jgi:hypothetical protein
MRRTSRRFGYLLFLMAGSFSFLSFAQGPGGGNEFAIRDIHQQLVSAPQYASMIEGQGTTGASFQKKWLRVETTFDSTPEWADDVTLKYYVLMGKGRETKLFTGEATYVNVARGTRHVSALFINPNTVERYGQGRVETVAVELLYKGRLIDRASEPPTQTRWWERYTPVPGYLVPPHQTPWSLMAYQRYEQLKPSP